MKLSHKDSKSIFQNPPFGYDFAEKYKKSDTEIGIFPSEFKNYKMDDLPISRLGNKYYFWAEKLNDISWIFTTCSRETGCGYKKLSGDKNDIKSALVCSAFSMVIYDDLKASNASSSVKTEYAVKEFNDCLKARMF